MSYFIDISAALDARLALIALPTAWENKSFKPVTGEIYLRPTRLDIDTLPTGIESSSDSHKGIYQIDVFAPLDAGKGDYMTIAEQVIDQFKRGTLLTYNGTTVKIQNTKLGRAKRDSAYASINIDIEYISFTPPR